MRQSPGRSVLAVATLAAALLLAAASAAAQEIAPPKLPFEKHILGNGLNLLLHEDHSTPIVGVTIWYHVGSKNEVRGRTGFAHLFEHMMFQGSLHHDTDYFRTIEPLAGNDVNGSTTNDRTNYLVNVQPGSLEKVLWMEADRMGWLLPAMTQERLDNQKEVVKNERRQGVDNQPYGTVDERMYAVLYPSTHPYSWDVIGYMDDLSAATKKDVEDFFKTYYAPNNCTLVIAGDIDPAKTKALVEKYFGPIPPGPPVYRMQEWIPELTKEARLSMEDRVPLPRIYVRWHAPAYFRPGDAEMEILAGILADGKTSRLYKRLVYDLKIAQDVNAYQDNREISSLFTVVVTAREGRTLEEIEPLLFEEIEKLRSAPPSADEVERVRTGILANTIRSVEQVGMFGGKGDRLAMYNAFLGDPGYIEKDFDRYQAVTPASVQAAARRWLHDGRVVMTVRPFPEVAAAPEPEGMDRAKSPELGPPGDLKLPALQRAKLSNGLEVILAEAHKIPIVDITLIAKGGWSADKKEKLGVASFMSRMQDEGTRTRSALQISEEARRLGAILQTSSQVDACQVSLNALRARLQPSIDLWSDVVLNPTFPQEEIDRQRQQVLGQILQEKRQPVGVAIRIVPMLLYGPDHPYGQPLTGSGTEESVKAIAQKDLLDYHATWFKPNNATLVVVGDTTLGEIVPVLEKALGGWKAGDVPKISVPERKQPARTAVYLVDKPGAPQSVLVAGHLLPPRSDPETVPFEVLNNILGGAFVSRLNMNLREEKGYTYGAYTFALSARHQQPFIAFTMVQTDATKDSISEMLKEFREIRGPRPVTAGELVAGQDFLVRSLPGQYDAAGEVAGKISELVLYGLPEDFHATYARKVQATTPESLTALAGKRIFPDNVVLVVVGDRAAIESGIRELNVGPIEYLDLDGKPVKTGGK